MVMLKKWMKIENQTKFLFCREEKGNFLVVKSQGKFKKQKKIEDKSILNRTRDVFERKK